MTASHDDDVAVPPGGDRRRLLTFLGAGGAAVVATQLRPGPASAGHDATNTFHLGAANASPGGATTSLSADVGDAVLAIDNADTSETAAGLRAHASGTGPGIEGTSMAGPGVIGRHTSTDGGDDEPFGVSGEATNGSGVRGHAELGAGVQGSSISGVGLVGFGGGANDAERQPGVLGLGFRDHGVMGLTEHPDSAGVFGSAHSCLERGSEDPEDPCNQRSPGTGVLGIGEAGIGVRGASDTGTGVEATSHEGLALRVLGRSGFATAGAGVIPAGGSSAFVSEPAAGDGAHVTVTLTSPPGNRQVHWVELASGSGFTVHLSAAPPKQRPETTFTYLVVEPA